MTSCRVEAIEAQSSPSAAVGDLDEFLVSRCNEMDHSMQNGAMDEEEIEEGEGDVYSQLEQKERDLILAAELGKALLDKNEDLKKKNEQLQEEIDKCTQEKHELRLKLESTEGEYEATVRELQNDIAQLQHDFDEQQKHSEDHSKNKSHIVHELTQQNVRLTEQVKQASETEEQLQLQVEQLRVQVRQRRTSMTDHMQQLELLRAEINLLTDRRGELEKRITHLTLERDALTSSLEESQVRIMMLEKHNKEQDQQVQMQSREIGELQEQNVQLSTKVEGLSLQISNAALDVSGSSLFNELEMSSANISPSPSTESLAGSDLEQRSRSQPTQLKSEILEVYRQLQGMIAELQGASNPDASPRTVQLSDLRAGSLLALLSQLQDLMKNIVRRPSMEDGSESDLDSPECLLLDSKVNSIRSELVSAHAQIEKLKAEMEFKDQQLSRKTEELSHLSDKVKLAVTQLSLQHNELVALQEERDRLQDQAAGIQLTADDVLQQTRKERNEANERRNELEQALAKSRLDVMNMEGQLMEAIQQKIALSQQLEMWQVDMHDLISAQMAKQMQEEAATSSPRSQSPAKSLKSKSPGSKKRFPFSRS